MEDSLVSYHKRRRALMRKHERMSRGYVTRLNRNGTFEQVPDSKASGVGLKIILLAAVVFFGFKVLLFVGLGAETYQGHVDTLNAGTPYEKVGAWFMQVDPVTAKVAEVAALLRS